MKFNIYRDHHKGSPVPQLGDKWENVGTVERDSTDGRVSWADAVREATGKSMVHENDRGIWYKVLPEGRRP